MSRTKGSFKKLAGAVVLSATVLFGCGGGGGGGNTTTPTVTTYTLTTSVNPAAGGTVSPDGTTEYNADTTVTITATAASGYVFVNWTGAGVANANNATTTVSMTEDRTVTANFAIVGNAWDGMSCNSGGVCVEVTSATAWNSCPVANRFPTADCTADLQCTEGSDCPSDVGSCTVSGNCTDNILRSNCTGTFDVGEICGDDVDEITFYCPTECTAQTGTSRPSNCFATADACLASIDDGGEIVDCGNHNPATHFCDSRDGQVYRYVTIGSQVWMAENLNYETDFGSWWCYRNDESNCDIYGRLYDWATAMGLPSTYNSNSSAPFIYTNFVGTASCGEGCFDPATPHRGICPAGWHLPSLSDWETLRDIAGGGNVAPTKLKASTGWERMCPPDDGDYCSIREMCDRNPSTDEFGFSALPGGQFVYEYEVFQYGGDGGSRARWWTTTEKIGSRFFATADSEDFWVINDGLKGLGHQRREIIGTQARIDEISPCPSGTCAFFIEDSHDKRDGNSVRCVRDPF